MVGYRFGARLLYCVAADHGDYRVAEVLSADGFHSLHGARKPVAVHGVVADQDGFAMVFQPEVFDCDTGVFLEFLGDGLGVGD